VNKLDATLVYDVLQDEHSMTRANSFWGQTVTKKEDT